MVTPFRSSILKLCLFATGLSGIVAEYVLSTLATYFLGDSVFQWSMIVSIMLFSMGLGSRFSKFFENNLLSTFINIEFILSIIVSFISLIIYTVSAWTHFTAEMIYSLSILVGMLIGMEIPLVIRINERYESLKVNVSSAMENDYYGSLLGGVFFAFVGLPYLGITHTPFVLGSINFGVAIVLIITLWHEMDKPFQQKLTVLSTLIGIVIVVGALSAQHIIDLTAQKKYKDQIIYDRQTKYQKIVITQSGTEYWLYINGNQQLSTLDERAYHEALVHPAILSHPGPERVLVLGGGDGCAVRELLKHPVVKTITLVDLDPVMTELGKSHPVISSINGESLHHPKVSIVNQDAFTFLEASTQHFDVIIVDLPDPKSVDIGRMYSVEFYSVALNRLRNDGLLVTQAGSPFFAEKGFFCIEKTMQFAGFQTIPYHHYLKTLGEWGWVVGKKSPGSGSNRMEKNQFTGLPFDNVSTKWINKDAMEMMLAFGKPQTDTSKIKSNTLEHPVLHEYYLKGKWDLY